MRPSAASVKVKVHDELKQREGKTMNENETAEVIEVMETEDRKPASCTERIVKTVILAQNKVRSAFSKIRNEKVATCIAAASGAAATGTGVAAAAIGTTTAVTTAGASAATITAAGAGIGWTLGGAAGCVIGGGACMATMGVAAPTTFLSPIVCAATGASVGGAVVTTVAGWLGIPIATTVAVTTAPVWAAPLAVSGAVVALGTGATYLIRKRKRRAA